jgi:O-antigen/teichoic acid export membrane protein
MKLAEKIAVNSSVQALRQIITAVSGIVSVAIVTRYLSVDEYGAILAAVVLISLLSFATDFGIAAMTVRAIARDPEHEVEISSSAFWAWVAFTTPSAILIFVASQLLYPGAEGAVTRDSVLILLLIFPLGPFAGVAGVRAVADQRVWVTSLASIVARVVSLGVVIACVALKTGTIGIAAALASGYVLEQAFAIAVIRPRIEFRVGLHRTRIWALVAAAIPLGMVMVLNGLYFKLDGFLLSVLGTQNDLAVYGVAYKAFESLVILPEFVMITLLPVLAKLSFDSPRFQELVQKAFTSMTILALPLVGFSLIGSEAMVALAGPKYAEGGLVLALIMIGVAFSCVQGVFGNTLVTQGRAGVLLKVSGAVLVANGLINLAAIPLFGARGAAATLLVSEALSFVLTLRIYGKLAPVPRLHNPLRLVAAVVALAAVALLCLLIPVAVVAVAVAGALGLLVYVIVLVSLHALPDYLSRPLWSLVGSLRSQGAD